MQTNAALLTVAACFCTLAFTHASVWPCFRSASSLRLRSLLHAREVKDPVTILLNIRFSSVFCHLGSRRLLLVTPHRLSDESLLTNFSEQTADTWQSNVGLSDWPRAADVTNSTEAFDHDVSSLVGQLPVGEEFVVTMATCYVGNCRGVVMGDAETRETTQEKWWEVVPYVVLGVVAVILVILVTLLLILAWCYRHSFRQFENCCRLFKRKGDQSQLIEHYDNIGETFDRGRREADNLPDLAGSPGTGDYEYGETGNPNDQPYDEIREQTRYTYAEVNENDANRYLEAGNPRNSGQQTSLAEAAGGPNAWANVNSAFHDDTSIQMQMRNF